MYSNETVLPQLRFELQTKIVDENNIMYAILIDPIGYADEPVIITYDFFILLESFDGLLKVGDLIDLIAKENFDIDISPLLAQIEKLDEMGFLMSKNFLERKSNLDKIYLDNHIRPSICAGSSYPEDPDELTIYMYNFFNSTDKQQNDGTAKAIIAPHIDFRLGLLSHEVYSAAYHSIRNTDFDLVVILGTSHFANSNHFMLTNKSFHTPLGVLETDTDLVNSIINEVKTGVSVDEFAHKPEHSIELHTVLLRHYFKNKNFKILPILVGSFFEFINEKSNPMDVPSYFEFISKFDGIIKEKYKNVLYISSVDFSHIGRKFGDEFDAVDLLEKVKIEDIALINFIESNDADSFFNKISFDNDKWKICGTSPIYTLLKILKPTDVEFLRYNQWSEHETQSAVTFASFALK